MRIHGGGLQPLPLIFEFWNMTRKQSQKQIQDKKQEELYMIYFFEFCVYTRL